MARKTAIYTAVHGRDAKPTAMDGSALPAKQFLLTEMSSARAERWAFKALLALKLGGLELPDDLETTGLMGLAKFGLMAFTNMRYEDAAPLFDEMMTCVQAIPDPRRPEVVRPLIEDDIEEVRTLLEIRREVFKLHVDFSEAAGGLMSALAASQASRRAST